MSEVDEDLSNLKTILLNTNSQNDSIRADSERQIIEMMNAPERFLCQLINVMQIPDMPVPAAKLSLILISQMLQPHSLGELLKIREFLQNNPDPNESLKLILNTTISNEDTVIRNFSAKSYALLFQILQKDWIDGLNLIVLSVSNTELQLFERFSYLKIFFEITQLVDYELIFTEDVFFPMFRELLNHCINFIGSDHSIGEINAEIRTVSSKCIINFFYITNKNETRFINDEEFFKDLVNALQYSFPIPDFNLFQSLLQIMECMIKFGYNYDFINEFLETFFHYSMNCFDIPNTVFCEATLFFWSQIAQFEFMKIIQHDEIIINFAGRSAEAVLQICKNIFDNTNLLEILNPSSDTFSLVSTARVTITNIYKCSPKTVFEIITSKFHIFEKGSSPFTTFCFLSSITIKTESIPFSDQFLLFIHENWENILSLEHQVLSDPNLINDVNMTATRIFALISLKKLISTLPDFANLLPTLPQPEHPTKKLDDIFTLIKNNQGRQNQEHPAILISYARLIGAICYRKDKNYTQKQDNYIDTNYDCLCQYLWSLFDLNYVQFNYQILESTTKNLNTLILNALRKIDEKICILDFSFFTFLFTYTEEKLKKSNTLFESDEVRYSFQKSCCSIIGALGTIMATNNDVCQRSFETLISLVQNPNKLIYEEALRSVAMFIPKVKELIDPSVILPLTMNAIDSLNSNSNQIIISASFLLHKIFESVPDGIIDVAQNAYQSLQRALLDNFNSEFRESHYCILITLSTLFSKVNPEVTVNFKDDFLSLIKKLESVVTILNTRSQDDLKYANIFYQYLSDCFLSYVNVFMPEKPEKNCCTDEILEEQKKILERLYNLACNICKIPDSNKADELLESYLKLVDAITSKTSRANGVILNKLMIRAPIILAERRFGNVKEIKILQAKMRKV